VDISPLAQGRAGANGHVAAVQALGALHVDVHRCDAEGVTALHWAAGCGQVGTVAALVALGADVDAMDMKGLTPLDRAAGKGEVAAIQELVGPVKRTYLYRR